MKNLIALLLFICATAALAQEQTQNDFHFFKNDGTEVNTKDSADYVRVISEPNAGRTFFKVKDVYPDGKLKMTGESASKRYAIFEGVRTTYFRNGEKQFVNNYAGNKLVGDQFEYFSNGVLRSVIHYPAQAIHSMGIESMPEVDLYRYDIVTLNDSSGNGLVVNGNGYYVGYDENLDQTGFITNFGRIHEEGHVKNGKRDGQWKGESGNGRIAFTETYVNGKLKAGTSIDSAGNKYQYTQRCASPQYRGGVKRFYEFISKNMRYPAEAREKNIQGQVLTVYIIKTDGSLKDISIAKSPHNSLSDESFRVLSLVKNWLPGAYCGIPMDTQYHMPLSYTLASR